MSLVLQLLLWQPDAEPVAPPAGTYRHTRSGIFESGVGLSGLVPYALSVKIGGVQRGLLIEGFSIRHALGEPSTLSALVHGFTPEVGEEIVMADESSTTRLIFGGTIVRRKIQVATNPEDPRWQIQAIDWTHRINGEQRVFLAFDRVSANTAIHRIVALADPSLKLAVGYVPSDLGTITRTFTGEPIMTAIAEIASAVNAYYRIRPGTSSKRIDLFRGHDLDGNLLELGNETSARQLLYEQDLTQIRTRVQVEGGGGATTARVARGATTIPVDECGWYSSTGGRFRAGNLVGTYAGRSSASGPGELTGVTGVTQDIAQGTPINVLVQEEDVNAQAELASRFGGGATGVVVHYERDNRISIASAMGRAQQNLAFFKAPTTNLSWSWTNPFAWPGKLVNVNRTISAPSIVGQFRLQSVTLTFRGDRHPGGEGQQLVIDRAVVARPGRRHGVVDILVGAV